MMGMVGGPGGGGGEANVGGGGGLPWTGSGDQWQRMSGGGQGSLMAGETAAAKSWAEATNHPHSPAPVATTPQPTSPLGGGFYGRSGGASPPTLPVPQGANTFELIPHRVFVGGFPVGTSDVDLREFFEAFGVVREVKLIKNPDGSSRGYGFITYATEGEAARTRALPPERLKFKDRRLNIGPAMRRINLTTRYSDLALAHPAANAPHMPTYLPQSPAQPGFPAGYASTIPYNFLLHQVPPPPNHPIFYSPNAPNYVG